MKFLAALVLLLGIVSEAAHAQAYQCTAPAAPVSVPTIRQDGPTRHAPISGYTLALSWAPEFCRFRADSPKHARECSGKDGIFGLIVHGLWPEARGQAPPQWCASDSQPAETTLSRYLCMTPSAYLLAHEWAKHGSCITGHPATYYAVTQVLWHSLRLPDFDRLSRKKGLTAADVRRAFASANGNWPPDAVGLLIANRGGWLKEIHLCLAKNFRPTKCGAFQFGPADDTPVSIWRGL